MLKYQFLQNIHIYLPIYHYYVLHFKKTAKEKTIDISTMISTGFKGKENLVDMPRALIIEERKFRIT